MQDNEQKEFQSLLDGLQSGALTYDEVKKRYLELGDQIRQRYEREYTALSIDIVQSGVSKMSGTDLDAQITFDAYHNWIEARLAAFQCQNFTWAGDGLLAIFESPDAAVACARSIRDELGGFNARLNRLPRALQIRLGIHTGTILPGDSPGLGKIASRTFDLAAHLQKSARPNQIRLSETTYALLREGAGQFVPDSAELPNPSAVFVYPPESASGGAPHPAAYSTQAAPAAQPVQAPFPRAQSPLPWVLGGVTAAAAVSVALVLATRPQAPAVPGSGPLQVIRPQGGGAQNPQPGGSGNPSAPPASPGQPAAAPVQASGGSAPAPAPARSPSPFEPSRAVWRSPAADSGLPPSFAPAPAERKWVLAIGVGRYQDSAFSAEGAGSDARFAAGVLQRSLGVPVDHVRVIADGEATLDGIKSGFQWLQRNATSGQDLVAVYLAGAAVMAPDRPDFRHQAGTGYALIPADGSSRDLAGTALYGWDVASWLGATRCQTAIVFADTAHGAALDLPGGNDPGRLAALVAGTGVVQKTRGRGAQASAFAESLAAGLAGAADSRADGRITVEELRNYLGADLPRRSGNAQTPEFRAGFGGFMPDLVFGRA